MALDTTAYLGLLVPTLVLIYMYQRRHRSKLPPGPTPLPILGNILQIDAKRGMHNVFSEWADKYGDMFTYWQFTKPVVVLSGKDVLREAMITRSVEFADRPHSFSLDYISRGGKAIGLGRFTDAWRHQKKVSTTALKMYGDGLANLERISKEVLEDFQHHLLSFDGKPILIDELNRKAIINVITSMILGKKFDWNDPDFQLLDDTVAGVPGIDISRLVLDAMPWLRHIVPLSYFKRLRRAREALDDFFSRHLKIIEDNFDPNDIRCFADSMYQQLLKEKNMENPIFDYELFVMTIFGVFVAGFATTSIALTSLILILMQRPDIEEKMVAEIMDVLGEDRLPALADKESMPYTNAVIFELLRFISQVPVAFPHTTTTDVEMRGYVIPKGTLVFMNIWKLHHDENLWENPWTFKPERFLEPDTGEVIPPGHETKQSLLAFGAGRRVCMGEVLAKNRLFLFIAGLYQKFRFLPEEGVKLPPCESKDWTFNFIMTPPEYRVRVLPRH